MASRAGLLAVAALALAGCAPARETGTLAGKVTAFNPRTGEVEPVAFGRVYCHHLATDRSFAGVILDGAYEVHGVYAGEVKILILSPPPEFPDPADPADPSAVRVDPRRWFPLPERFGTLEGTPLKTVIRPGTQTYDIEMR
jgi:hypothetical protein